VVILFSIFLFTLNAETADNTLEKDAVNQKLIPKDIALKLQKSLVSKISPRLDPQGWKKASDLLNEADSLEKEGKKKEASEKYTQAGQILLKIEKEHPYKSFKNGNIKLGKILLDKKKKTISFPAIVKYQPDMPVEVLLCTPLADRNYEALFFSTIRPIHLQTILYLAGYENGARVENNKKVKQGSRLRLFIKYTPKNGAAPIIKSVEEFLCDEKTERKWQNKYWIFVGSNAYKGRLLADITGESIITWCSESAIIQPSDDNAASGKSHLILKKQDNIPNESKITFIIKAEK
jgi:hypothetical protein